MKSKLVSSTKVLAAVMAVAAMGAFVGCGGGGGGGGGGTYKQPWYDVWGYYCGSGDPKPGCNFYSNGVKVIDVEDPYFSGYYNLEYGTWTYTDSYGVPSAWVGWGWLSPTGILYDDWGNALNQTGEREESADMMEELAAKEAEASKIAGGRWASAHSLSAATGEMVAGTLNKVATFARRNKRDLTDADVDAFARRLGNVNSKDIAKALDEAKRGDFSGLKAQNAKIAKYWNTSEAESEEILADWYSDVLKDYVRN